MSNELDDLLHEFHAQVWHAAQIRQGDTERNERAAEETRDIKRRIRELWNTRSGSQGVVTEEMVRIAADSHWKAYHIKDMSPKDAMRAALLAVMGGGGDGWVACSERTPANEDEILACTRDGIRFLGYWDGDEWWAFTNEGDADDAPGIVTHWRPLPPPPATISEETAT